jgi:tetratricopeptide (TPR) repeat protein
MTHVPRRLLAIGLAVSAFIAGSSANGRSLAIDLLNRYEAGDFDAIARQLDSVDFNFAELLKQLQQDGSSWIEAVEPGRRERRRIAAATLALEAARADAWHEWKWVVRQPPMCAGGECYYPPNVLYWRPAPLLLEWGCRLLRQGTEPTAAERVWHLAALSVAQRSEDPAILIGDPNVGRGRMGGEIGNTQDEINHLSHSRARFPAEGRFVLAEAVARERRSNLDVVKAYDSLAEDVGVGGEALMRLGVLWFRANRAADALKAFDRAESISRDPYVLYVTNYIRGRIAESQKRLDPARAAYERAVAVYPHGQSATVALSALLFQQGLRAEAQSLVGRMFAADPLPPDPWRDYVHADDRFWPQLLLKLRTEIRP